MDPVSGLKPEFFRTIATILVPGAIAASPYALIVFRRYPATQQIFEYPIATATLAAAVAIFFGMLIENLGSRIEHCLWQFINNRQERDGEWQDYLRLRTSNEIVGQRYLRTIITRLKFELAVPPTAVIFGAGAAWHFWRFKGMTISEFVLLIALLCILTVYYIFEANCSINLLADVRCQILAARSEPANKANPQTDEPAED